MKSIIFYHLRRLGTFLQPLLEKTIQINQEPVVEQPSSPEPSSLFGQPSSAYPHKVDVSVHDLHDDLEVEIENLYKGQILQDFIMDEVIDEKQSFLMEGWNLCSPAALAPS